MEDESQAGARTRTWWLQFPAPLRELAVIRLIASLGAGGVLYLTPMVFHRAAFSAGSVTQGLALAALAGTAGRLGSGLLLDRGLNPTLPVALAALLGLGGDGVLAGAQDLAGYRLGQVLLGCAAGLYWPAVEMAVPLTCPPVPSARGFALVRSADAAGIAAGALIGAVLAGTGRLRGIYGVDMAALLLLLAVLRHRPLPANRRRAGTPRPSPTGQWLPPLLPLLAVSVLATAMPALMQSALPLDLVRGGWRRGPLPEGLGALLIGLQLVLLLVLQWPVGRALARHPVARGLTWSLVGFAAGTVLLAASSVVEGGGVLLVVAQLPLAAGEAAFLPTATEAVVELCPEDHRGMALALFSQCFALSAFGAPLLAGWMLDAQGHGAGLWSVMAVASLLGLLLVRRVEGFQRGRLLQVLSGDKELALPPILYRLNPERSRNREGGPDPGETPHRQTRGKGT